MIVASLPISCLRSSSRRDIIAAKRVLRTIRDHKDGKLKVKKSDNRSKYLTQRKLRYAGYKLLRNAELVGQVDGPGSDLLDYLEHELHFEYVRRPSPRDTQFTIRMPSGFHEGIAGGLGDIILEWFFEIQDGKHIESTVEETKDLTRAVASQIKSTLATAIPMKMKGVTLEADLSYTHKGCFLPGLLVEVAWSQRGLKLQQKAKQYIEGTDGQIRTVVGLNMNNIYKGGRNARLSVWEAVKETDNKGEEKWAARSVVDSEFIDEEGKPVKGCELRLSMKGFICEEIESQLGSFEDVPLRIPAEKLHEEYIEALSTHSMGKVADGIEKIGKGLDQIADILTREENTVQRKALDPNLYKGDPRIDWDDVEKLISQGYLANGIHEMRRMMEHMKEELGYVTEAMKRLERVEEKLNGLKSRLLETEKEVEAGILVEAGDRVEVVPRDVRETAEPSTPRLDNAPETWETPPPVPQSRRETPETPSKRWAKALRLRLRRSPKL